MYSKIVEAYKIAIAHEGGRYQGWCRMMMRNSYTIDPVEPEKDSKDMEKESLLNKAKEMAIAYIIEGNEIGDYSRFSSVVYAMPKLRIQ